MPRYVKFHGLELADNSFIENLRVEKLTSDPTPSEPGRLWYNTTDKVFKFSSLDSGGAVITHQAVSLDELTAEVATLNATINAEVANRTTADTTLQTQIDTLETAIDNVEASITFAVSTITGAYVIGGDSNPALKLQPGITYKFELNASGHPFRILTDATNPATEYNDGVSHDDGAGTVVTGTNAQGKESGTLIFKVPMDSPDYLYYVCDNHPSTMVGTLKTTSFPAEVQVEIDDIETGAGLETDGSYLADNTTNYLTAATSLKNADFLLDSAVQGVQNELDSTQNGAGLGSGGTYSADSGTNYLTTATSLKNADATLDGQLKTTNDNLSAEITARTNADVTINTAITNLQSELDVTQTGAGLATDGTFSANSGTNYLTAATSLKDADEKLDTALNSLQSEVDATQTGAGLGTNGAYTANSSSNYITGATDLTDADDLLDAQIKTTADNANTKVSKSGDTMSGNLDMGNNRIISVANPTDPTDAANKEYVDSVATGLDVKESVRVATTSNISNLSSVTTVDGVTLVDGDRVLVKDQSTGSENGIYTYTLSTTTLARSDDADTGDILTSGTFTFVEEGTLNADNGYVLITDGSITVGTTSISFEQFSGAGQIIAGAGIQKSGNELFLNFGAGVSELPSDEIGIDVRSDGGLMLTADGSTDSVATGANLAIRIDGSSLSTSSTGLKLDSSITTSISDNATAITTLQTEVDAIETAAGLNTDGTYAAPSGTNYIDTATSIANANVLLDTAVKDSYDTIESLVLDLESDLATEQAQRISADSSIRTDVNSLRFTYQSTATATTHTISHNLNTNFLLIQCMVLGDDNLYANDVVPIEETDANTLTVYLTESRHVRVSVMAMTDI